MKQTLDKAFWDSMYRNNTTGWDMGMPSPSFVEYVTQLSHKSKPFLIPGAGNAHEVDYLINFGFTNIHVVDISMEVTSRLKEKFKHRSEVHIYHEDFFKHIGQYDYIFEQTFFCAIAKELRPNYVSKMHELLSEKGRLFGVLFDRTFTHHPPFGGSAEEYRKLFEKTFFFHSFAPCYNSHPARQGSELWINLQKKG